MSLDLCSTIHVFPLPFLHYMGESFTLVENAIKGFNLRQLRVTPPLYTPTPLKLLLLFQKKVSQTTAAARAKSVCTQKDYHQIESFLVFL